MVHNFNISAHCYETCAGGNDANVDGKPAFILGSLTSGNLYLTGCLDIYNYPVYNLVVAAYTKSSPSGADFVNASRITVQVIVDDTDNYGPSFDTGINPSPNCAGVGRAISRGL